MGNRGIREKLALRMAREAKQAKDERKAMEMLLGARWSYNLDCYVRPPSPLATPYSQYFDRQGNEITLTKVLDRRRNGG
jgi:hypothetical protein